MLAQTRLGHHQVTFALQKRAINSIERVLRASFGFPFGSLNGNDSWMFSGSGCGVEVLGSSITSRLSFGGRLTGKSFLWTVKSLIRHEKGTRPTLSSTSRV